MPAVAELRGLWQRSLIALPDGSRDTTTEVRRLQGMRAYATQHDCLRLADQQGFAGYFSFDGDMLSLDLRWEPAESEGDTTALTHSGIAEH